MNTALIAGGAVGVALFLAAVFVVLLVIGATKSKRGDRDGS